jgi:hypothetical protein
VVDGVENIVVDTFQHYLGRLPIVALVTVLAGSIVPLDVIVHVVLVREKTFWIMVIADS